MEVSNEISLKIKTAIKAKLLELGIFIGEDELPDYIMVMIANKRSQEQMNEDLGLFLGETTETFTSWLHGLLARLQSVASEPITVMVKPLSSTDTPSSKSPLSSASVSDSESSTSPKKAPKLKSGSSMAVQRKNIAPKKRKVRSPASSRGEVKKVKSSVQDPGASNITETEPGLETGQNDLSQETEKATTGSEREPEVKTVAAERDFESAGVQEISASSDLKPEEKTVQDVCDSETDANESLNTNLGESSSPVVTALSVLDTDRELNLSSEMPSGSCEATSPIVSRLKETLSTDETVVEDSTSLPSDIVGVQNNDTPSAVVPDASSLVVGAEEKRKDSDDGGAPPAAESKISDPALHETKKVKRVSETCADSAQAGSGESVTVEKREGEETVDPTLSSEPGNQVPVSKSAELRADSEDVAVDSLQHEAVKEASCPAEYNMTHMMPNRELSKSLKVDGEVCLLDWREVTGSSKNEAREQPIEVSSGYDPELQQEVKSSSKAAIAEDSTKASSKFADSGTSGQGTSSVSDIEKFETDQASNQKIREKIKSSDTNKITVTDSKASHSGKSKPAVRGSVKQKTDSGSQKNASATSGTPAAVDAGSQPCTKTEQLVVQSREQRDVKDKDKQRSVGDKALVQSSSTKMTVSSRDKHKHDSSTGQSSSDAGNVACDVRGSQQHRGATALASGETLSRKVRVKQSSAGASGKLPNTETAEVIGSGQSKATETKGEKQKIKRDNQKTASTSSGSVQPVTPKSSSSGDESKQADVGLTHSATDKQMPAKDRVKQEPNDTSSTSSQTLPRKVTVKPSSSSEKSKQPVSESAASERRQNTSKHECASGESVSSKDKSAVGANKQKDSKHVIHSSQQTGSKIEKQRSQHSSSVADQSLPRKVTVKTPSPAGGNTKEADSDSSQSGMPADRSSGVTGGKKEKTFASDPLVVKREKPAGDRSKQSNASKSAQSSTSSDSDSHGHVRGGEKQKTAARASPTSGREKTKLKALPSLEKETRLTDSGSPGAASDGDKVSASGSVSRKESKSVNRNSASHHSDVSKSSDGGAKKTSVSHSSDKESKTRSQPVSVSDSENRKRRSESMSSSDSAVPPHKHAKQDLSKPKEAGVTKKVSKQDSSHVRTIPDKPAKVVKSIKTEKPSSSSNKLCKDTKQKVSSSGDASSGQRVSDKDLNQKRSAKEKVDSAEHHAPAVGSSKQKISGDGKADSKERRASDKGSNKQSSVSEKSDSKTKPSSVTDSKPKDPGSEKGDSKRQSHSDKDSKQKIHVSDKDEVRQEKSARISKDSEGVSAQASEKDSDEIARELESQGHIRRIIKLKRVA